LLSPDINGKDYSNKARLPMMGKECLGRTSLEAGQIKSPLPKREWLAKIRPSVDARTRKYERLS
jgi:hypothetical protein